MNTFKFADSKSLPRISKHLFGILVLIGLLPAPSVEAAIDTALIQRTEDIRQRLLEADMADTGSHSQQQGIGKNEPLLGWYDFPDWGKFRDWRDY